MSESTRDLSELRAWHRVVVLYFSMFGIIGASVTVRLPLIKELLGVTPSLLGIIFLVGSVGAIGSLNVSGRLIEHIGTRPATLTGLLLLPTAMIAQMIFVSHGMWVGYMVCGFFVGAAYGLSDVAINLDGTVIERELGRSLMPRMHAAYSLGALAGSGIGTVATYLQSSILWQVVILGVLQAGLLLWSMKYLPSGTGRSAHHESVRVERHHWLTRSVWFMGLALLTITLAEGSANDWLAIGVVEGYGASKTNAGIAYSVLMAAMTITRFWGGNLADRFGKTRTLQGLAVTGVAGILLIIVGAPHVIVSWIGAALWGCGVALGFPLLLSAAGEAEHAAKTVAFVAFWGYGAFIVGPPLLGFLGQAWGMLHMFSVIAAFLASAVLFTRASHHHDRV